MGKCQSLLERVDSYSRINDISVYIYIYIHAPNAYAALTDSQSVPVPRSDISIVTLYTPIYIPM